MPLKNKEVVLGEIREEMRQYGIPHDRVDEIIVQLIEVGQNVICASLGEMAGGHYIDQKTLRLLVGTLVAHSKQ